MATDVILVLITLAATLIGTILNPRPWVKGCIILLAVGAASATLFKAHDDNSDKEFVKRALTAQIASSKPSRSFLRALTKSMNQVAQRHGLVDDGSVGKDLGTLYYFSDAKAKVRAGAFRLGVDDAGDTYAKYVAKQRLDPVLETMMFKPPDAQDRDQVEDMLNEIAFVGNVAIDDAEKWVKPDTEITESVNPDALAVTVAAEEESRRVSVGLGKDFLRSIIGLPPVRRNWRAYQEFERQLRTAK